MHRHQLDDRTRRNHRGFTLFETVLGIVITSLVITIVAGITHAVQTSSEYSDRLQTACAESSAILDRMQYMLNETGVYEAAGGPSCAGVAVLVETYGTEQIPSRLVVWSGGRDGGMAAQGVQNRLPKASELLVYLPDPDDPARLWEVAFPGNNTDVDFRAAGFALQIETLITGASADVVELSSHLATAQLSGIAKRVPTLRFDSFATPSHADLATALPGTTSWEALPWIHGMHDDSGGLRQWNIQIELQIARAPDRAPAEPAFAASTIRYWHRGA